MILEIFVSLELAVEVVSYQFFISFMCLNKILTIMSYISLEPRWMKVSKNIVFPTKPFSQVSNQLNNVHAGVTAIVIQ